MQRIVPEHLRISAQSAWDYALHLGEQYGYRNANVTCLAPTGTTSLVMDCDTTGIEPDFALVKFKKLVGGGYFKIANHALKPALKNLGYPNDQIQAIIEYTIGKQTLNGAPHINVNSLIEKEFEQEQIDAIEAVLPTMFELKYAFTKYVLGEVFFKNVLKISEDRLNDPELNVLKEIGFSDEQISEASQYICGAMTIEGAPYLKKEDYPVFDTANKNGDKGKRYIAFEGHLKQMAAAQPYLSGAISKTINMPEEATIKDMEQVYMRSWRLMLKATALYRDGSKLSQPLTTSSNSDDVYAKLFDFSENEDQSQINTEVVQKVIYNEVQKPFRKRMPAERHSITHKFSVTGHEGFITVGLYENGRPGEIFITMSKEGSTLSGIANALAKSISLNLQYGVPIEAIVRKFSHVRFEPSGLTNNPEIPIAKSLVDYIARWLGLKFLDKDEAKKYHDSDLVDKSYTKGGSNYTVNLKLINGNSKLEKTEPQEVKSQTN
jgi:ribonucleoside-diphosphate reductase alpha chain